VVYKEVKDIYSPDKAKPFVRKGQKATGLRRKMAELPKDKRPLVCSAFLSEVRGIIDFYMQRSRQDVRALHEKDGSGITRAVIDAKEVVDIRRPI